MAQLQGVYVSPSLAQIIAGNIGGVVKDNGDGSFSVYYPEKDTNVNTNVAGTTLITQPTNQVGDMNTCSPLDGACIAQQLAISLQTQADHQAVVDAEAANSAIKWAQSGGTVDLSAMSPAAIRIMNQQLGTNFDPSVGKQIGGGVTDTAAAVQQILNSPGSVFITPNHILGPSISNSSASGGNMGSVQLVVGGINNPSQVKVGQTFQIMVSNAGPAARVQASSSKNGVTNGIQDFGVTDINGNLTVSGTFDNSTIGQWIESWIVNGQSIGVLNFTVSGTSTTNGQQQQQGTNNAGGAGGQQQGTLPPVTTALAPGFANGLEALTNPSIWSAVFQTGDMATIAGLLVVPVGGLLLLTLGKGK